MMAINRRKVLRLAAGTGLGGAFGWQLWQANNRSTATLLSAADDVDGQHCLVGKTLSGTTRFCLPVPERAHQVLTVPNSPYALFMGRRPSALFYVVDVDAGRLMRSVTAPAGHHFYGHGVIDEVTGLLYATENDYLQQRGIIGIYQLDPSWRRIGEMNSGGLGPHQIERLPGSGVLVVANGGIETHPEQGRDILNLDTMAPNLTYLEISTGRVITQAFPQHHQMSVRHFAVTPQQQVILGIQDHRLDKGSDPVNPLVLSHHLHSGDTLIPLDTSDQHWRAMRQYIASVAVSADGNWALTTTPRGNLLSLWDLTRSCALSHLPCRDVAGVLWLEDSDTFVVSNGLGQLLQLAPQAKDSIRHTVDDPQLRWDNHLCLSQLPSFART